MGKNEVGTNVFGFSPKNSTTAEYASYVTNTITLLRNTATY